MLHLFPTLASWSEPAHAGDRGERPPLPRVQAPEGWSLEGDAACSWRTQELSVDGVVGDPAGADPQLGAELFERLVEGWRRRLLALLQSDWPTTTPQG